MAAGKKSVALAGVLLAISSVSAQAPAKRVISLIPAVTEMLFAIGAGPQVVGVGSFDNFPEQVKTLPRVGGLINPDEERIIALRPDLVITYGSQSDLETKLKGAGLPIFSYRHQGLEGIFTALQRLGPVVGHKPEADRLVRELRASLDRIKTATRGRARPRTLLVFERDAGTLRGLYVAGGTGFLNDMLEAAGGANVFADTGRESVQPSIETIIARGPEVILEIHATGLLPGTGSEAEKKVWNTLASVPAVRSGRIYLLNGAYLVVPGPRVAQATEAFARALHPDAFK